MADEPDPWKHTRALLGDDFLDQGDPFEFDLLAELAKDPANGLVELAPGVYHASKPGDRSGGWLSGPC